MRIDRIQQPKQLKHAVLKNITYTPAIKREMYLDINLYGGICETLLKDIKDEKKTQRNRGLGDGSYSLVRRINIIK